MTRYNVRSLCSGDFEALRLLEADVTCHLALADGYHVADLLCFVRDRDAGRTPRRDNPEFQRSRVTPVLLGAFERTRWFTLEPASGSERTVSQTVSELRPTRP